MEDRGKDRSDGKKKRRCETVLDDINKTRGYGKLKEEGIDCAVWATRFGRGSTHVVRQTTE